jgi:hypothetical protein
MFVMMIFFLILDFIIAVLLFVTFLGRAVLKNVNNTFATNVGALVDAIDQYIEAPLRKLGNNNNTSSSTQNNHRDEDIESAVSSSSLSRTKHGKKKWAQPNPLAAGTTTTRRKKHGPSVTPPRLPSAVDNVPGLTAIASTIHIQSVAAPAKSNRNKEL